MQVLDFQSKVKNRVLNLLSPWKDPEDPLRISAESYVFPYPLKWVYVFFSRQQYLTANIWNSIVLLLFITNGDWEANHIFPPWGVLCSEFQLTVLDRIQLCV